MQCLARDPRQAPERFLAPISSICTTASLRAFFHHQSARAFPSIHARAARRPSDQRPRAFEARGGRKERRRHPLSPSEGSFGSICRDRRERQTGRSACTLMAASVAGVRAARRPIGAPLTAQPIEIEALKIGNSTEPRYNQLFGTCPRLPRSPTSKVSTWPSSTPTAVSSANRPRKPDMQRHFQVSPPSVHGRCSPSNAPASSADPGVARSVRDLGRARDLPVLR